MATTRSECKDLPDDACGTASIDDRRGSIRKLSTTVQVRRQISDEAELERIAATVLAANQGSVASFRAGKEGLLGFFVGQVMKATAGRANPAVTQAVLRRLLSGSNPD